MVVEPGVRTGVPVLIDNPREVGTDRIINALAAGKVRRGCIVVDLRHGDHLRRDQPKGENVGGAIAPGIEISLEASVAAAHSCARWRWRDPAR